MNSILPVSQAGRVGRFHSPSGPDSLVLVRFSGDEGINTLGAFRVEVLSPSGGVDLDACLGAHGTVEIRSLAHGPRWFDGIIAEAEALGPRQDGWLYRLTLRPWLWLAGLRRNQRIFHGRSAPEIVEEVLGEYDFPCENRLSGSYEPLEYTVQYRESDLDFVCRMAERFGVSWHFEHEQGAHRLVLTDAMTGFREAPGGARPCRPVADRHNAEEEHFSLWSPGRRITTGRVVLTDYNFKAPKAAMLTEHDGDAAHAHGGIESFDYPGGYPAQDAGRGVARLRGDQERAADGGHSAEGDAVSLAPGMLLGLSEHPDPALAGGRFLLTGAEHGYEAESYVTGERPDGGDSYRGRYRFHPAERPFAPVRATPAAKVAGPQTAVVVGEGEIDCDEYGRILVRFHWDLAGAHSMRCRVAQLWSGPGWGGMAIPRVGMEVVVEFLEGDPDQPLVTGCVYNARNMPPYDLPGHKTRMTVKSKTHQGEGFNELRFEDEAGREEVFMHAQKDHNTVVLNDQTSSIGNDKTVAVVNDHSEHIGANMSVSVGGAGGGVLKTLGALISASSAFMKKQGAPAGAPVSGFAADVGAMTGAAGGAFARFIPGAGVLNMVVAAFRSDTVGMARTEQIGLYKNTVVGHTRTVSVGRNQVTVIGETQDTEAGAAIFTRTKKHTALAAEKFTIGGPGGTIVIDPSGIRIKGKAIKIEAPGIDFTSGSANAEQVKSDKPFSQDCG